MVGRENGRTNNRKILPTLKNNAAADYQGSVRTELWKEQANYAFSLLFAGTWWLVPIYAPEGLRLCAAECLVERNNPKAKTSTGPPPRVPFGYHNTAAPPWNIRQSVSLVSARSLPLIMLEFYEDQHRGQQGGFL